MRLFAIVLVLALSACGTPSTLPADFLNPQAPQAGSPFPYNSPWCN